ncbi:putative redox protein PWA37_004434 [Arxiozyma heterogenica]|uniref:Uncharacterized protein n=1 Tax=Arxiozyma heterogenica TaxID=278026 RepID=A0AAN7W1Z6_9SACH|nr:hypothetical protein RI543_003446 [Kazachstania heterogenica]
MSMFRTLQKQTRIVTLFAHDLEVNKVGSKILEYLKSDTSNKFTVEISTRFPTQDQLKYMNQFDTDGILGQQIKSLDTVMNLPSFDSIYGLSLKDSIKRGIWNPKNSLWVDWERQRLGNSIISVKEYLKNLEAAKDVESRL